MRTIICSSRRDGVLIILIQFYGSTSGLFESNLFWGNMSSLSTFILEEPSQY